MHNATTIATPDQAARPIGTHQNPTVPPPRGYFPK
jgi:hypothetical protein